jgi:hypothetical protein
MATDTKPAHLKKGDRVVATEPLRGVPEGTPGRIKVVDGLGPWIRAWVEFGNGVWLGSISVNKLVREGDWEAFQEQRIADAERAAEAAKQAALAPAAAPADAAAAPAADGAAPASGEASKVPAALLARSQAAKARKAAAAAEAAEG